MEDIEAEPANAFSFRQALHCLVDGALKYFRLEERYTFPVSQHQQGVPRFNIIYLAGILGNHNLSLVPDLHYTEDVFAFLFLHSVVKVRNFPQT